MSGKKLSQISKIYSKALIDKDYVKIKAQLEQINDTLKSSNELILILENTSINSDKKIKIIEDIFTNNIDGKLLNLLKLLVEKNRISEIGNIYESFCQMTDEISNIKNVEVVTAIELNNEQKAKILEKLKNKFNSNIMPIWIKDESIIAGLVFRFGDNVLDMSVEKKLEQISKR